MDAPAGVLYTGMLMAISVGMTAWRVAAAQVRFGVDVDRVLGACLILSTGLFVAVLLPHYLPGLRVP